MIYLIIGYSSGKTIEIDYVWNSKCSILLNQWDEINVILNQSETTLTDLTEPHI
jgi:hypothetical protein